MKKKGRGACDSSVEKNDNTVAVSWYDSRAVNLVSSFVGPEPFDKVQRYDRGKKVHVDIPRRNIVKVYNRYMGGIDKLDMMVALYKPKVKSRRWYVYLWLHSIMLVVVNAWILYRRDQKELGNKRYLPLRHFQAKIASSLVAANKARRGRPSLETPVPLKQKRAAQGQPEPDVRKDGMNHMPAWEEKRQ